MLEKESGRESELLREKKQGQPGQLQRQQDVREGRSLSPFAQMDRLFDDILSGRSSLSGPPGWAGKRVHSRFFCRWTSAKTASR